MKYPQKCCACGQNKRSRNIVMLEQKTLTLGKGWGCLQCGLKQDGAVATICDNCAALGDAKIRWVYDGWVSEGKLVPIEELPDIPHQHNLTLHPEVTKL